MYLDYYCYGNLEVFIVLNNELLFSFFRMKGLEVELVNGKENSSLSVKEIMLHLLI